ncbi:MAG: PDZ domain-containing protein [Planctomycetes bacterium]|nr:PDZ domain-containing protein [Planctomycetota bacterium]
MRKPKLSVFSLAQLIITVAAVMFGVYGVIHSGEAPANAPVVANATGDVGPLDGGSACSPLEMPIAKPQPVVGPVVKVDVPREPAVFNPDDRGSGSMKGTIRFTDGRAVEGMKVMAISTQADVGTPTWDLDNIAKTHKEYDDYFRALERNTRITYSDATGNFAIEGLDPSHSYRVSVNDPEIGESQQVARSGSNLTFQFEVPVVLEGVVSCEGGKLPRDWWVTVNADSGQGWFEYVQSASFHDADGKFRIRAKAGKVQVVVTAAGWVQDKVPVVEIGAEGGSCDVRLLKAASLSGTVTSTDGNPMPSVAVTVAGQGGDTYGTWRGDYDGWEESSRSSDLREALSAEVKSLRRLAEDKNSLEDLDYFVGGMSGYTDQDGKYRIEGLRPGTFTVTATMGSFEASREITLGGGENYADFSIDSGCRVKIVATNTSGKKVTPSYAWFIDSSSQYAQCVQLASTDGSIEYIGIKEGTWTMTVQAPGYPQLEQEVRIGRGSNTVDVVFEEPATLTGKISSPSGKVPANLYVCLTSADGGDDRGGRKSKKMANAQWFTVDAKGNYKAENLKPGDYNFSVQFNQNDQLYNQALTLSAGEQTQDAQIDEGCSLTVTVDIASELKSKDGISISVSKTGKDGGYVSRYAPLDSSNRAEFSFLPEGDYYVMAYCQDGTQSYVTATVNRGSNAVTLSLGPPNCVKITQVADGYQAADAGVLVGDLIIEYNGIIVHNMEELVAEVQSTKEEDNLTMVVVRDGSTLTFRLKGGRIGINGDNFRR